MQGTPFETSPRHPRSVIENMSEGDVENQKRGTGLTAVLADDSVLLREGIARLLDEAGIEVVGQAGEATELMRKIHAHKPDVAVIDVRMPPTHTSEGLKAAIKIRNEFPEIGVLVLSQYGEYRYAAELMADNAAGFGYLLKDRIVDINQFTDAVVRVAQGGTALDPGIISRVVNRFQRGQALENLTNREYDVLRLMAEGRTNSAIADRLIITLRSAEKIVGNIFQKLGLESTPDDHRRVLAVLKFMRSQSRSDDSLDAFAEV